MKQFAYILMDKNINPEKHQMQFETKYMKYHFFAVKNFEEAKEKILQLIKEGVGAFEICGAFGREKALELIELTENKVLISYVIHEPSQNEVADKFFGR